MVEYGRKRVASTPCSMSSIRGDAPKNKTFLSSLSSIDLANARINDAVEKSMSTIRLISKTIGTGGLLFLFEVCSGKLLAGNKS